MIINGIPEEMEENRVKEFVGVLFGEMVGEGVEFENLGRIGKKADGKYRAVRVRIEEAHVKRQIMGKAKSLKENETYAKTYITPDLTRKQQKEDKTLRDRVKDLRKDGVKGVKIERGEVVRWENGVKEVLFSLQN